MNDLRLKDFEILSEQDQNEALALLSRFDQMEKQEKCQGDFIEFVKHILIRASCRTESIWLNQGNVMSSCLQRLMSFSSKNSISSIDKPSPPSSSMLRPTPTVVIFAVH